MTNREAREIILSLHGRTDIDDFTIHALFIDVLGDDNESFINAAFKAVVCIERKV